MGESLARSCSVSSRKETGAAVQELPAQPRAKDSLLVGLGFGVSPIEPFFIVATFHGVLF